jgi:hypothetical protein
MTPDSFDSFPRRGLVVFIVLYGACLMMLSSVPSLWLDEILELVAVRSYEQSGSLQKVTQTAGAVPLGYLLHVPIVKLLGYSAFSGRLPSILFSLASCVAIFLLGRAIGIRSPLWAVALFAIFPLQLRYALEVRPYSPALCWSTWSLVAFLALRDRLRITVAVAYGLCLVACLYTQPYSLFIPLGQFAWLLLFANKSHRRLLFLTGALILLSMLSFLPWYLHAKASWNALTGSLTERYRFSPGNILMILKELTGAGYIGTGLVLVALYCAVRYRAIQDKALWVLCAMMPVAGAVFCDIAFGYFLAIRQMLFVLAPLAALAAAGIESLYRRRRKAAATVLLAGLATTFVVQDVRFFFRPRGDWKAATATLAAESAGGGCIVFLPPRTRDPYLFFQPDLAHRECANQGANSRVIVASLTPYQQWPAYAALQRRLLDEGFREARTQSFTGPWIEVFARPAVPDGKR